MTFRKVRRENNNIALSKGFLLFSFTSSRSFAQRWNAAKVKRLNYFMAAHKRTNHFSLFCAQCVHQYIAHTHTRMQEHLNSSYLATFSLWLLHNFEFHFMFIVRLRNPQCCRKTHKTHLLHVLSVVVPMARRNRWKGFVNNPFRWWPWHRHKRRFPSKIRNVSGVKTTLLTINWFTVIFNVSLMKNSNSWRSTCTTTENEIPVFMLHESISVWVYSTHRLSFRFQTPSWTASEELKIENTILWEKTTIKTSCVGHWNKRNWCKCSSINSNCTSINYSAKSFLDDPELWQWRFAIN